MATYAVTYSEDDNWGEEFPACRYKSRREANAHFAHERERGRFVRLTRWAHGEWKEMDRSPRRATH